MLSNQAKVESLIFVSGNEGISITDLAHLTGLLKPAINEQLKLLIKKYNTDKTCSFELVQTGETVKFTTKKAFAPLIKSYFEDPATTTLSQAAIILPPFQLCFQIIPLNRLDHFHYHSTHRLHLVEAAVIHPMI